MHPAIIIGTVRSLWTWLWGRSRSTERISSLSTEIHAVTNCWTAVNWTCQHDRKPKIALITVLKDTINEIVTSAIKVIFFRPYFGYVLTRVLKSCDEFSCIFDKLVFGKKKLTITIRFWGWSVCGYGCWIFQTPFYRAAWNADEV